MSLYKQLWLAVVVLLSIVFGVSLLVTTLSAKTYLEQQLTIKNSDNAAALALSLSQQGADEVLLELTLAAQFDTGFYELIELADPQGNVTIRRVDTSGRSGAPRWFMRLFAIEPEPGQANLQAGWQQAGSITLRSHSRFAYEELWQGTLELAGVFLLAALLAGLVGSLLLKRILRPLSEVVGQAEALKERRFISIPEPATLEFRQLVSSMNSLAMHIQSVLGSEARQLQKWQREAHVDKVTGLSNREPFLNKLESFLSSEDVNATGTLVIVRITHLSELNHTYGRHRVDALLKEMGKALNRIVMEHNGWAACRLNGSDFAIVAPREMDAAALGERAQQDIGRTIEIHGLSDECLRPGVATVYMRGEKQSEVLTRMDAALATALRERSNKITVAHRSDISIKSVREQMSDWRTILEEAFADNRFSLLAFPVVDRGKQLVHMECPAQLKWHDATYSAGQFLPWVNRLRLSEELDKRVINLALRDIERTRRATAVNLTVAAVAQDGFIEWLEQMLISHSEAAQQLWLEIPESLAFRHFANFKRLCRRAKLQGAKLGIEHVGHQLAELGRLHDVGLDYLKIDASFVRNLHTNPMNQTLIGTLCTLGHAVGLSVIAEGVNNNEELEALLGLGIDGATGPGISLES